MQQVLRQGDLLNTSSKRGENNLKVGRKTRRSSTHVSKRQAKNSMEIYKRLGDVKGEAEIFIKPQNWLLL
jgi:hypothetical protein